MRIVPLRFNQRPLRPLAACLSLLLCHAAHAQGGCYVVNLALPTSTENFLGEVSSADDCSKLCEKNLREELIVSKVKLCQYREEIKICAAQVARTNPAEEDSPSGLKVVGAGKRMNPQTCTSRCLVWDHQTQLRAGPGKDLGVRKCLLDGSIALEGKGMCMVEYNSKGRLEVRTLMHALGEEECLEKCIRSIGTGNSLKCYYNGREVG